MRFLSLYFWSTFPGPSDHSTFILCVRLCVSISEKGILANIIANFNFVANLYTVSRWVRQMKANVPKVKLMVNTLKFKCLQSFKKNRVNTIKGTKPSGKLKPCQSHNAWRNVDYEQSLFLQNYWGECTRAQARIACSKRSDSGERCEVKKAMKSSHLSSSLAFIFWRSFLLRTAPH